MEHGKKVEILEKLAAAEPKKHGKNAAKNWREMTNTVKKRCGSCRHFNGKGTEKVARCTMHKFLTKPTSKCDDWTPRKAQ